ncbi:protease complex subunit PrcB family protein [Bernardetia sp.]|uniref:protease complex subunit PrcB family protein n=1 Tax=Bernardetia sp. TaxID=1937974 RepID=UPI0025C49A3B|nr:protease complex subunit PrcB family protein [Bernardetia sp.]
MKLFFLYTLSALFISMSSCKSNQTAKETPVPFETVFQSVSLGSETAGTKVVQSQADLKDFEVANNNEMPKELLSVDFDKNTMIMVMAGTKNTGGFEIEIEKIIEENDKIIVFYKETNPPKDAMLIMALTYPLHAVSIKKTKKEIVFEKMSTVNGKK